LKDVVERVEPLACFDGIELRSLFRGNVTHTLLARCGGASFTASLRMTPRRSVG
jgi:hypothetical protein